MIGARIAPECVRSLVLPAHEAGKPPAIRQGRAAKKRGVRFGSMNKNKAIPRLIADLPTRRGSAGPSGQAGRDLRDTSMATDTGATRAPAKRIPTRTIEVREASPANSCAVSRLVRITLPAAPWEQSNHSSEVTE